jgi:hypothetical protein
LALGCTAISGPPNPVVWQLVTMNLPHPELSEAPTMTML